MSANAGARRCALCGRAVARLSRHHLVPRSEGGRTVVELCAACHQTLHAFFSNRTLSSELNTLEALSRQPGIARYLRWVSKQQDRRIAVRVRKNRR